MHSYFGSDHYPTGILQIIQRKGSTIILFPQILLDYRIFRFFELQLSSISFPDCRSRFHDSNRKWTGSNTRCNPFKVEIIIQDLNDNSPIFPESELTIHIAENAQIGTEIRLDSATDADTAAYGIERYYLGEEDRLVENPYFDLQEEHINDVIIPILKVIFYFSDVFLGTSL